MLKISLHRRNDGAVEIYYIWRFPDFYEDKRQSMAVDRHRFADRGVCLYGILWRRGQVW